ncbi:zinc ribbon domain-containing protein [Thermocrinis sp.]
MKDESFSKMLLLQEQEGEVVKRERYLERVSQRLKELDASINKLLEEQAVIIAELNQLIDQIREEELRVRSCKEYLRKWEERAKVVKKAEEYKALLRERAKNEDCIIKGEQKLRELKEAKSKLEASLQDREKRQKLRRLEEEKYELLKEKEEVERELSFQRDKLESLKREVSDRVCQDYERLKKEVGFPPFVSVDAMGTCGNCGTKLPSSLYSKLVKGESVRCPSCGKVLYQ